MTNRKLQAILFGVLLTFSAGAVQSQTAAINNARLNQIAQIIVRSITSAPGSTRLASALTQQRASLTALAARIQPAGGSLVINGVVQETGTTEQLFAVLQILAAAPGFDPASSVVIRAASPSS